MVAYIVLLIILYCTHLYMEINLSITLNLSFSSFGRDLKILSLL